jgi:hypothetical protein
VSHSMKPTTVGIRPMGRPLIVVDGTVMQGACIPPVALRLSTVWLTSPVQSARLVALMIVADGRSRAHQLAGGPGVLAEPPGCSVRITP